MNGSSRRSEAFFRGGRKGKNAIGTKDRRKPQIPTVLPDVLDSKKKTSKRAPKRGKEKSIPPLASINTWRAFACDRLQRNSSCASRSVQTARFVMQSISVIPSPTATLAALQGRVAKDPPVMPYDHVHVTLTNSPPSTLTTKERNEKETPLCTQRVLQGYHARTMHLGAIRSFPCPRPRSIHANFLRFISCLSSNRFSRAFCRLPFLYAPIAPSHCY